MPKKLTRLRINEGSLVDRPANPGASVLLWKRHEPNEETPDTTEDDQMTTKHDDLDGRVEELEDQIGALTKANADLTEQLKKVAKGEPVPQPSEQEVALARQLADATEALKAAEAARKEAEEKLAKHEPAEPPEEEVNLADLPAAVRRRLEDADNLRKTVEESKAQIAKLDEERKIEKCAAKIQKNWPSLPIKAEHFAPIYSKVESVLKKDELKELENIFTSHAEAMKIASSALGREFVTSTNDAWDEIVAKAEALRKVDPKLTEEQAIAETSRRFPDLYAKYREERQQSN